MPRILLVEDEQVNRDLFRRRLERKGHTVVPAENGLGAVALTKSEKPDLVLMDLGLPDIDGWEATRRVKADPGTAAIPVIVLSAHATSDAKEKAFAAGCQDFETKPVNWDVLYRKIDEWLAKAQEVKEAAERAAREAAAKAAPPPPPAEAPTGTHPALPPETKEVCAVQPKRILVVEDNDPNRVMLCRRLQQRGFQTVEAADGRPALDALRAGGPPFDLILCDIMMPVVDGYQVLREVKADPALQTVPIIMISALDDMAGIVKCIEMGAEDYLHKPYDPVLLFARITACLDKRRLRDQELAYLKAVAVLTHAAEAVEKGQFDPAVLASVAQRGDDLGTLARVFERMAREVQARVRQLQADVQQMTRVEVDPREVVKEVARVTDTAAFERAVKFAAEARAKRAAAPSSMTDTMMLPRRPKE